MARYAARLMEARESQRAARRHGQRLLLPAARMTIMARPRWPATAARRIERRGALKGARILVVEARYYEDIADTLLAGAKRALDAARRSV